jgi:hypothetical protein
MKRDAKKLAAEYIDDVIQDQHRLGYTKKVRAKARADAERRAAEILAEMAGAARSADRAVAA